MDKRTMEREICIAYYIPYFPQVVLLSLTCKFLCNYYLLSSSLNLYSLLSLSSFRFSPLSCCPYLLFFSSFIQDLITFPSLTIPCMLINLMYSGFLQFESPPIAMLGIKRDLYFLKLVARDYKFWQYFSDLTFIKWECIKISNAHNICPSHYLRNLFVNIFAHMMYI